MKEKLSNITNVLLFKHFSFEMLTVVTDNASAITQNSSVPVKLCSFLVLKFKEIVNLKFYL